MRYWFDTEFIEDGRTIDLISIGIVAQDGREYYAVNWNCELEKASGWVKENVISQLPPRNDPAWKTKDAIAFDVMGFLKNEKEEALHRHTFESLKNLKIEGKPEIWAYYADYDWVCFCQLFGTMMDLPKGFPMYCRDIKQWSNYLGNPELPIQGEGEHNALADAKWNKTAWEFLDEYETKVLYWF
ncbi:3'-5' exoribonuclease domain-containing protein [Nostoc sp.]|uniref:3'-5' exoribonuclease domain-containing protein n=1 Tax=Nostoc sp. TaxID=1180 RepID=UPI002FF5D77C